MSKLICVDFDGVLHSYTTPWINLEQISGPPVEGAIDFVRSCFSSKLQVAIFSTRNVSDRAIIAMKKWLISNGLENDLTDRIQFPAEKPTFGSIFIDDRGYLFTGPSSWPSISYLKNFKPWNK